MTLQTKPLNNAVEVLDIDLADDDACRDLGRLVADESVVVVRQAVSEVRLSEIQCLWGSPSMALLHQYVADRRLAGIHWRQMLLNMFYVSGEREALTRVSYETNDAGKPTGIFVNGELDWHGDQQAFNESQRVVGLMSLWGTEGSRTDMLCTADAYANLSAADQSMVDELVSVWEWDGGSMCEDLIDSQKEVVHYNMVPLAGMESPLSDHTASGVAGIKFPSHCFSHFRGMSIDESAKFRTHLWQQLNQPQYIYEHTWVDGEIVFLDQNITLHRRPTNVQAGDRRTMARMTSYMNHLFPDAAPVEHVRFDGQMIDQDSFAALVDTARASEYALGSTS